jgi:hypothetical protein
MPRYRVSGFYTTTHYVDRYVEADSESEAESKAWSGYYDEEIETGYDEGDFESDETEEIE